jgi:hypothetical protein
MNLKPIASTLLLILAASAQSSFAQDAATPPPNKQPTPEQMQQVMQGAMRATMNAMLDIAGPITEATINAQMVTAAKPETAERLASFKKNLYDALVKKGFTASQALQIVVAANPPSASIATK